MRDGGGSHGPSTWDPLRRRSGSGYPKVTRPIQVKSEARKNPSISSCRRVASPLLVTNPGSDWRSYARDRWPVRRSFGPGNHAARGDHQRSVGGPRTAVGSGRFEEELRTLVNARSVSVRDCAADAARPPDVISFDVPAAPWTMPARLEAVFEFPRGVTESQMRTLSVGAQIASLLVQIECASGGAAGCDATMVRRR